MLVFNPMRFKKKKTLRLNKYYSLNDECFRNIIWMIPNIWKHGSEEDDEQVRWDGVAWPECLLERFLHAQHHILIVLFLSFLAQHFRCIPSILHSLNVSKFWKRLKATGWTCFCSELCFFFSFFPPCFGEINKPIPCCPELAGHPWKGSKQFSKHPKQDRWWP